MQRRLNVWLLVVAVLALWTSVAIIAVSAEEPEMEWAEMMPEPPQRSQEHMDHMANEIGLVQVSSTSLEGKEDTPSFLSALERAEAHDRADELADEEAARLDAMEETAGENENENEDAALVETGAEAEAEAEAESESEFVTPHTRPMSFVWDSNDDSNHVLVEAGAHAEAEAKGEEAKSKREAEAAAAAAAEESVKDLSNAERHIAYQEYQKQLAEYQYAQAIKASRQSQKFRRPLPTSYQRRLPHPQSHRAALNGDRVHSTLFPANTLKSDGHAPSQPHDFHHRGDGDPVQMHEDVPMPQPPVAIEMQQAQYTDEVNAAEEKAEEEEGKHALIEAALVDPAKSQKEDPKNKKAAANAKDAKKKASATKSAKTKTEGKKAETKPAPAKADAKPTPTAVAPVAPQPTPVTATPAPAGPIPIPESDHEAHAVAQQLLSGIKDAASTTSSNSNSDAAPSPCESVCEGAGKWRSSSCQDCIVRGMVNGWIVKSIVDGQQGYNYAHWARNQCVNYVNEMNARASGGVSAEGAPFAKCFFQKMHETCNL